MNSELVTIYCNFSVLGHIFFPNHASVFKFGDSHFPDSS